jgi:hypothetical protein
MRVQDVIHKILADAGEAGATANEVRETAARCFAASDNSVRGRLSKMYAYRQIHRVNGRYYNWSLT